MRFSRTIQPICLTQSSISQVGYSSVVAGWGSVRSGGQGVNKLRDVKVIRKSNFEPMLFPYDFMFNCLHYKLGLAVHVYLLLHNEAG